MFAETGARGDDVEDLDNLGAQAAGEAGLSSKRVFSGHATLLVSSGAQRQPGNTEESVVGVRAVSGRENVRQVSAHGFVDNNGALDAELGACVGGKSGVGPDPNHDQDEIGCPRDKFAIADWR